MQVPLEVTYRDVEKTEALETLVREKVAKLEQVCDRLNSCRVAIEKIHDRPSSGSPYRVRIDMTVPGQELVAESNPGEGIQYIEVQPVIRDAFDAARRQLQEISERQRNRVKTHEAQDMTAIVAKIFRDEGYGFIKTFDDREVYFHRNSVLHDDFDRLEVGTGVHFFLEDGEEGPQASTVKIVNKPGATAGTSAQTLIEPPLGWGED
ncbi:MAG: HPF/RaiA family ribosome-associated protein [Cyanobacteriota bacterium]